DFRQEQRKELSMGGIAALEAKFKEHEVKIHDAQTNVDFLRQELGISDAVAAEAAPTMLMSADSLRKLEALRIETDAQFMREETLVAGLTNLPHDQLIQALPTAAPDTLLSSLLEQQSMAEQKLVLVTKQYGPKHPEVIMASSLIDDLKKKIDNRVGG